jgi:hypothetical protein
MVVFGKPKAPSVAKRSEKLKINLSRLRTAAAAATAATSKETPCTPHDRDVQNDPAITTPRTPRTPRSSTPGSARQRNTPRGGVKSNKQPDVVSSPVVQEEILKDDEDDTESAERSSEKASEYYRKEVANIIELSKERTVAGTEAFTQLCRLISSLQVECSEERDEESASAEKEAETVAKEESDGKGQLTEIHMEDDL